MSQAPINQRRSVFPEATGVLRSVPWRDGLRVRVAPRGVFHVPETKLLSFLADLADGRIVDADGRPAWIEALGTFDDGVRVVAAFRLLVMADELQPGSRHTPGAVEAAGPRRIPAAERVEMIVAALPASGAVRLTELYPNATSQRGVWQRLQTDARVKVSRGRAVKGPAPYLIERAAKRDRGA